MIHHPAVLAFVLADLLVAGLVVAAAGAGAAVLRRWDSESGSRAQLLRERRTHLVSALLRQAFVLELLGLFFLVHVAGAIAPLLDGAMCAAGAFAAGRGGWPGLALEAIEAVGAGVWLVLDRLDREAPDFPLLRPKYRLLLVLAPLTAAGTALRLRWLAGLAPQVITSCCGSLFSETGEGLGSALAAIPARPAAIALVGVIGLAVAAALWTRRRGEGSAALALLAALALPAGVVGLVAVVSPYVYELPAHHCPFCLLGAAYHRVGYPLYAALLTGAVSGLGAGAVGAARTIPSLAATAPRAARGLAAASAASFAAFLALCGALVLASGLRG